MKDIIDIILYGIQIILPLIALLIVYNCFKSVKRSARGNTPLIALVNKVTKEKIPVLYWENSIGRSKSCDITIDSTTVSRDHAVLFRREKGWFISDTNSKTGVLVNKRRISESKQVYINDVIEIGGIEFWLKEAKVISGYKDWFSFKDKIFKNVLSPGLLLFYVSLFHVLVGIELCFSKGQFEYEPLMVAGLIVVISWMYFIINKYLFRRISFELESLGILLSGIGIMTICGSNLNDTYNQLIAMTIGLAVFDIIILFISNPDVVMKWRIVIACGAIGLFVANIALGTIKNGSQNWIILGPVSIQPSEFVKVAFVLVGTSTLERLQTTKNLTEFIIFSGLCMVSLFIMGDFGTACIFFVTFLIVAFMRSGSVRTVILICSAAALGAMMIIKFKPYITDRFSVWRHVWEHMNDMGYQQTRVMTYSASGGLFGLGVGRGYLKNVFASTSDLIFGMLCEEWGLILALIVVFSIAMLSVYSKKVSINSRSTFYSIAACSSAGLLLFQMCLNVFGATDILPLTGVTLPFLSAGGSSMVSTWGLLAFIKAADERTYAARR